mmetsp:Transcript_20945/g.50583  ORF Transcript_20945/g.50583 Transcript_20945/m.50583 type:complete len:209 (-) Transcript_20945:98-724(-)
MSRARLPLLTGFLLPELGSSTLISPSRHAHRTPPISPLSQFAGAAKALLLGEWLSPPAPQPQASPATQRTRSDGGGVPGVPSRDARPSDAPASPSAQRNILSARRGGLRRGASASGLLQAKGKHVSFAPVLAQSVGSDKARRVATSSWQIRQVTTQFEAPSASAKRVAEGIEEAKQLRRGADVPGGKGECLISADAAGRLRLRHTGSL